MLVKICYLISHDFSLQHVDKVRLTSSLVNADTKRILGLLIEDVRFTKDCIGTFEPRPSAYSATREASNSALIEKLLPTLTSFVQV